MIAGGLCWVVLQYISPYIHDACMKIYNIAAVASEYFHMKCRLRVAAYFENGDVNANRETTEISYYIRDTKYKMVLRNRRGPRNICSVNGMREFPALGPYGDFHGINTTPAMIGFPDGCYVEYRGSKIINYTGDSVITV